MIQNIAKKDIFFQQLKGFCIIFVVFIHFPIGDPENWTGFLWLATRKIINFPVATFFFLSAFYSKSYKDISKIGLKNYYKKRVIRLLIPYLFWQILYVFIIPLVTQGALPQNWIYRFCTGYGPTYFLLALLQFNLLQPFIQKYKNVKVFNIIFYSITPIYIVLYYTYNFTFNEEFKPEQLLCFPWFIFYYLGIKMQDPKYLNLTNRSLQLNLFVILALIISMIEGFLIFTKTDIFSFSISQITAGSILYSVFVILLFMSFRSPNSTENILSKLGDYSMGIFLSHLCVSIVTRNITKFLLFFIDDNEFRFIINRVMILILTIILSYFLSKIISKKSPKISKILGFQ